MSRIEARLCESGHVVPAPRVVPAGAVYPFTDMPVIGARCVISGHGPQEADGTISGPFGHVGENVTPEERRVLAARTAFSMLSGLARALGDLDRMPRWVRVLGMVNAAPGFHKQSIVTNGFSDLVLDVFGPEIGSHARSAIGTAGLPQNGAVAVEADVLVRP